MKKSKWTRTQIEMLIEKTRKGNIRMHAFQEVAKKTNRKTGSVRNFYYKNLANEKMRFVSFSSSEANQLLREIILGTSRGESVRSICTKMADGNKTKMLRFQNKYRAILRTNPKQIELIKNSLEQQGYFVKSPVYKDFKSKTFKGNVVQRTTISKNNLAGILSKLKRNVDTKTEITETIETGKKEDNNIVMLPHRQEKKLTDTDINNLFMGLMRLVKKQAVDAQVDGLKSQVNMLKTEIERLKAQTNTKGKKA